MSMKSQEDMVCPICGGRDIEKHSCRFVLKDDSNPKLPIPMKFELAIYQCRKCGCPVDGNRRRDASDKRTGLDGQGVGVRKQDGQVGLPMNANTQTNTDEHGPALTGADVWAVRQRREKFSRGPWALCQHAIYTEPDYSVKQWSYERKFICDLADQYFQENGCCKDEKATEEFLANGFLIESAPNMYDGISDAMETLRMIDSTGGTICAVCPWGRQCKTCALSEIFRLSIGCIGRLDMIQAKARGEVGNDER